jgi:hypothetical protein
MREILRSYNIYDIKSLSQQKLTATLDTEQVFLHSSSVLISKQYKQTYTWVDEPPSFILDLLTNDVTILNE